MEPDAVEIRVVACLVEKQRTTPDHYPLSLNALRLACNQSTNRDPVVAYDEATVSEALRRTALRGWTRLASGAGSRARKYRHLLGEALAADPAELALLAVLMLRGPQTPGELKTRTERLQPFEDLAAVHGTLERLAERGYAVRLERQPGQREDRYDSCWAGRGRTNRRPASAPPARASRVGDRLQRRARRGPQRGVRRTGRPPSRGAQRRRAGRERRADRRRVPDRVRGRAPRPARSRAPRAQSASSQRCASSSAAETADVDAFTTPGCGKTVGRRTRPSAPGAAAGPPSGGRRGSRRSAASAAARVRSAAPGRRR